MRVTDLYEIFMGGGFESPSELREVVEYGITNGDSVFLQRYISCPDELKNTSDWKFFTEKYLSKGIVINESEIEDKYNISVECQNSILDRVFLWMYQDIIGMYIRTSYVLKKGIKTSIDWVDLGLNLNEVFLSRYLSIRNDSCCYSVKRKEVIDKLFKEDLDFTKRFLEFTRRGKQKGSTSRYERQFLDYIFGVKTDKLIELNKEGYATVASVERVMGIPKPKGICLYKGGLDIFAKYGEAVYSKMICTRKFGNKSFTIEMFRDKYADLVSDYNSGFINNTVDLRERIDFYCKKGCVDLLKRYKYSPSPFTGKSWYIFFMKYRFHESLVVNDEQVAKECFMSVEEVQKSINHIIQVIYDDVLRLWVFYKQTGSLIKTCMPYVDVSNTSGVDELYLEYIKQCVERNDGIDFLKEYFIKNPDVALELLKGYIKLSSKDGNIVRLRYNRLNTGEDLKLDRDGLSSIDLIALCVNSNAAYVEAVLNRFLKLVSSYFSDTYKNMKECKEN